MLVDEIRDAAAKVTAESRFVRIDHDALAEFGSRIPVGELGQPDADPGRLRHGDDEATVAFVLALDAINFGSGVFPWLRKRPDASGYWTIAHSLEDHVAATGPLEASRLVGITTADCGRIFGQELDGGPAHWLMDRFAVALDELGRAVRDDYDGRFLALVESAAGSAPVLVERLAALPSWVDRWTYRDRSVPIFKRAQIAVYDLVVALGHEGQGHLAELDRLTMFADNLVPHVLRVDGVLCFDPDLVARIDAVADIPAGSPEEIEIRCNGLHAVELLVAQLRERGHAVSAGALDGWLWNRGADGRYKAIPRHRTRTTAY